MNAEKFTVYGGQRGGGKVFVLKAKVARLTEELKTVKEERDRFASELVRVSACDDPIQKHSVIIRISYLEMIDKQLMIEAIVREIQSLIEKHT